MDSSPPDIRHINEDNLHRAGLVLRWVTILYTEC